MWEPDQKLKRQQYDKEEKKPFFYENIRALGGYRKICKIYYLIEFFMEIKNKM